MEFKNDASNSPCLYMTAPNSPNPYSRSHSMELYYSAPATPRRASFKAGHDNPSSSIDEFEFGTSKRFSGGSESPVSSDRGHERGDSLPSMAFADELFLNGLVMPLKPPPWLHKSPLSSPRSPTMACRIPFARKSSWNDDFDPFMVALDKVREENRGRNSHHRRSRSYSPFRALSRSSSTVTADAQSQDLSSGNSIVEPMPALPPALSYSGPLDFKGSAYARWVRDQTRHGLSPKSPRGFLFGQRVRPLSGSDKPPSPAAKHVGKKRGNAEVTKVQKLKGLLVRYASFGRGNSGTKQAKTSTEAVRSLSYFGRLSFRFKGNGHTNAKKKVPANTKMEVVPYKPSTGFCLG